MDAAARALYPWILFAHSWAALARAPRAPRRAGPSDRRLAREARLRGARRGGGAGADRRRRRAGPARAPPLRLPEPDRVGRLSRSRRDALGGDAALLHDRAPVRDDPRARRPARRQRAREAPRRRPAPTPHGADRGRARAGADRRLDPLAGPSPTRDRCCALRGDGFRAGATTSPRAAAETSRRRPRAARRPGPAPRGCSPCGVGPCSPRSGA